mmetsp:Transcript_22951/g.58652  ORF Transcript_22951/g.58652 Transcript_22951/m.58652 type:complete len:224 (+) Transcript_22951:564-1235(+)
MSSHAVSSSRESGVKARDRTGLWWPSITPTLWPVVVSNTATVPSMAPHARRLPSGLYATLSTKRSLVFERSSLAAGRGSSVCLVSCPSSPTSHSTMPCLAPAAVASWSLSVAGEKVMDHVSVDAVSINAMVACCSRSHTRITESRALDAARVPDALTVTAMTPNVCPWYVCSNLRASDASQAFTLSSTDPVSSRLLFGIHAALHIPSSWASTCRCNVVSLGIL